MDFLRKALGLPRQKHQRKPENVENVVKNTTRKNNRGNNK